uniref:Erythema protein n=1 Tax=Simulium nigrimanum TaxID=683695 RepID=D1FQ15_SIMNI
MRITASFILLGLASLGAANVIGDGNCVTIMDGDLVMHERKPDQPFNNFLYMVNKGQEYNDQRWILESMGGDFYRLKNEHSNRYLILGDRYPITYHAPSIRATDHFKFVPDGNGTYDIVSRGNMHLQSQGLDYAVATSPNKQVFSVKKCQE